MALVCTPSALVSAANCIECALTHKQLLAALVYIQCTANGMNCTPSSLVSASTQIREAMTEKQLLAALVYIQCTSGGGGGGGGSIQVLSYSGADANTAGIKPTNLAGDAIAYSIDGTGPTMGWNSETQLWT